MDTQVRVSKQPPAPVEVISAPEALVKKYEQPGPRYTSYPTVPAWTDSVGPNTLADRLVEASREPQTPLSLYFHLPFCRRLCTYCGCNIVITRDQKKADEYIDHLIKEMDLATAKLGARRSVSQLHWGGGTPTFLDVSQLQRLIGEMKARFDFVPDAEISVEVNPVFTTAEQLQVMRDAGFNRLSMGVQDFDPNVQKVINRYQTYEQTSDLLQAARQQGYTGVNFDLVYGLPLQTADSWARTMDQVLAMRPDRFAVYAFAYLPEQIKHQAKLPVAEIPRGKNKLDLFRKAYASIVGSGYQAIGMDHFALPDDELAQAQRKRSLSRNFQGYTVKHAPDVVAFGMSAISDVRGLYAQNAHEIPAYYAAVGKGELPVTKGFVCSDDDRRRRTLITQLMCNFWVDLGEDGQARYASELEQLRPMEQDGLLKLHGNEITISDMGRFFIRNIAMKFDAYLNVNKTVKFSQTV